MAQAKLLFGQPDAPRTSTTIPQPPTFANFKFTTIGQQPQLLKRISAPEPNYQYDTSSPEPSIDQDHSVQSTPKALSRPTLLEALAAQSSDSQDATMHNSTDDMVVDTQPTLSIPPRGVAFNATRDPTPAPVDPPSNSGEESTSPISPTHPVSNSPQTATETSTHTPTPAISSPIPSDLHNSPYIVLRTLQSRLFSSLSSLKPPRMDTSYILHLVEAADSHSADALSAAHRANTLSQQALTIARDAAAVSQECLAAGDQAKAHASAAVSAVEQMGNSDSGTLKNEWEWKTVVAELRDGLYAMGQWVGERESEEAASRRELEMAEKERKNRESVESAMRMTNGSLTSLPAPLAMSVEVPRSAAATGPPALSFGTSVQTSGVDTHTSIVSRASAEVEADAARRAWSLEHSSPTNTAANLTTSTLTAEEYCETAEEKRRAVIAKSLTDIEERNRRQLAQKQQEQERERKQQKQKEGEAEIRRVQDLEKQKLEVARFHIQERERQERLQKEEAARRIAEADWLQKEADLLEEQRRKAKELEATKAAELRARAEKARAERLEQDRLKKQKAEEALEQQARLEQKKNEQAAQEQARYQALLEQQRADEAAARQAAEQKVREEEAQKVAEAKAAEDTATAAMKKAYEETQALEQQKRREVEEMKRKEQAALAQAKELELREVEEQRLREEQEKKRQEVMANKQRATAETAARILADRAQKEREKNGGVSATPPESNTPRVSAFTSRTPSTSQSPLTRTHPLPLIPPQQSPSAHIGNLTAKKTVAPSSGDASRSRRALSGGVKLGAADEAQSRPQSPTDSLPPSPSLARSAALGLRDKVPPIPKRNNRSNAQVASQPESNIPPAKRLSETQPSAGNRSSLSAKPAYKSHSDVSIATSPNIQSSGQVTPNGKPTAAGGRGIPAPVTPVMPTLTIFGDGEDPPDNNNQGIAESIPEPVSVHRRGQDTGNLHVIPQSKAPQPSPQAQAANLRFVKDEGGVLWNTYLKPDPDAEAKVEPREEDVEFSGAQVKKGRSTSPVIPRRSLDANTEPESPAAPSPVPGPTPPVPVTSSSTVHKPNLAALGFSAPKSRAVNGTAANSVESQITVPSRSNVPAAPTVPSKPKLPSFKEHKQPDNTQPGPNNTSNLRATNKELNTSTVNAPSNDVWTSVPKQAIQPLSATTSSSAMAASAMSFDSRNRSSDPSLLFEDSSAIAPVIQGDGGWDSLGGSPPRLSHNSSTYNQGSVGVSSWPDREPAWDSGRRKSVPRRVDHYSPPPSRQHLPPNPNRHPERVPSVQDQRMARPGLNPPRDRTPPPRTPPPPPMQQRSPVLGKRRHCEDDNIQSQSNRPVRRQRPDPQLEREDQVYRPELARTPPLERRPPTPEQPNGLQSRIGQRRYTADLYRPTYSSDHYRPAAAPGTAPTQPRSSRSYQPTIQQPSYPDYPPTSTGDSYRPDLLERMETTSANSYNFYHGRGKPPVAGNGTSRGRRGRGGSAGGNRPLEQRISTSYNNNHLSLAHRLESPPHH